MIVEDLLDLTLREILEKYCMLYSLECDYYYGMTTYDDAEKLFDEYGLDDSDSAPIQVYIEPVIPFDFYGLEFNTEIFNYEHLEKIMDYFGVIKNV